MAQPYASIGARPDAGKAVEEACERIPPLWPLQSFVAVNPFLGLSGMPFEEASRLLERVGHGAPLMDAEYYLRRIREGAIAAHDVRAALAERDGMGISGDPISWLYEQLQRSSGGRRLLTVADWMDERHGTGWAAFVVDEISKWCSSYFDLGQSAWEMPWKELPLYAAWKRAAAIDANPEVFGLRGFRELVRELPDEAEEAIEHALEVLEVPAEQASDFLHRELMSVFGWSAFAAFQDRQGGGQSTLRQLLAIRLAYEIALRPQAVGWQRESGAAGTGGGSPEAKYIAQLALEHAFRSRLIGKLQHSRPAHSPARRKALQAIFCIDVRSEVYRRALEAQAAQIETIGFAGFFGMPIEFESSARCPVLIAPKHRIGKREEESWWHEWSGQVAAAWNGLRNSAASCFPAVEVSGGWFGWRMLQQSLVKGKGPEAAGKLQWQIPLAQRVELAAGALKNMSIDASRLAPMVLLCGHGSRTENNPYAASLDCGACGGHKGDLNARFAAALMNDPEVRAGLRARGMRIPHDTVFVAGLHITTTDEVMLYDDERLLTEQQAAEVQEWLKGATERARRERSLLVAGSDAAKPAETLAREVQRRSMDWAEVRPEWGLAGNAAFVAAPRWKTRDLNLGGRVFLHEYDSEADEDCSVLQLILTAPVVVASWINLQYFGSTVNNRLYGSGNKVLHNVVGTFGIWEGNGGDLRTGLPLQSLHDGEKWVHEPLRLQVVIAAPRTRIDRVLVANPGIRALAENRWILLLAMEQNAIYEYRSLGVWQRCDGEPPERWPLAEMSDADRSAEAVPSAQ